MLFILQLIFIYVNEYSHKNYILRRPFIIIYLSFRSQENSSSSQIPLNPRLSSGMKTPTASRKSSVNKVGTPRQDEIRKGKRQIKDNVLYIL